MKDFIKHTIFEFNKVAAYSVACMPVTNSGEDKAQEWRQFYRHFALLPVQTHSLNVGVIDRQGAVPSEFPDTDALISFNPDVPVGVLTADCVPIVVYAPDIEAVAAIHAGWKGTLGGIIDNVMEVLCRRGADPGKMTVGFGPSISAAAYEVDRELARKFADAGFSSCISMADGAAGKPHIDLQGVNSERMLRFGISRDNIIPSTFCTMLSRDAEGSPLFPSYRRNKTSVRLVTYITFQP